MKPIIFAKAAIQKQRQNGRPRITKRNQFPPVVEFERIIVSVEECTNAEKRLFMAICSTCEAKCFLSPFQNQDQGSR